MSKDLPAIGTRAGAPEIRARWAYSEMRSPRFRGRFARIYADLIVKANSGVAFSDLCEADRDRLLLALNATRNPEFAGHVDAAAEMYECRSWAEDELLNAWALPEFNPPDREYCISFKAFLMAGSPAGLASLEDCDPRVAWRKRNSAAAKEYQQEEPIIVIGKPGTYIILDGYFRTLAFVNSREKSRGLLVWIPLIAHAGASGERR